MSRRNGTSRGPPFLITPGSAAGKLFGKLDSVAVRVVDVEEAHLGVELEHGSDLDSLAAQALGLSLDVVDVDRRDARVFLGIPLGDRDLHLAVHQPRPTALFVQVGLDEAELPRVEAASGVEVAHLVPDLDRLHSIRPGSSSSSLSVWRKFAAGAPSTVRWSKVAERVMRGRTTTSPSIGIAASSIAPT